MCVAKYCGIMSISSAATENHHNGSKLNNWEIYRSHVSLDIPSQDEFISDVRRPSLLSLILTDSVCSNSSFECNDPDTPEFEEEPVKDTNASQQNNCQLQKKGHLVQPKSYKMGKINDVLKKNLELEDLNVSNIIHDPSQKAIMKSLSMHDVSGIPTFSLGMKQNSAASCETIHSQSLSSTTKSKDSGFHRSVSCLSLNSGSRSYDHVQSKVKEYIRGIKESEAQRKKHFVGKQYSDEEKQESTINIDALEPEDLVETISKMELELKEKSVMLDTQQKNYNALLKKLAEAENTIDQLRLRRSSSNFYNSYHSSRDSLYNFQPYSYLNSSNMSLGASVEQTYNILQPKETSQDCIKQKELVVNNNNNNNNSISSSNNKTINKYSMSPCTIIENVEAFSPGGCSTPTLQSPNKSELRPVTRLFSSSCRLDRTFTPLAKADINNTKFDYPSKQPLSQNIPKNEQTGALDQNEEGLFSFRNSNQQRRKMLSTNVENHIDLPKVDPFDKVKKWQASLPSIHLLGYDHSATNSDVTDSNLKSPQLVKTLRRTETTGLSNKSLHELSMTSSVGRFTKSEQDLSCWKSVSPSGNHLKNGSANSVRKENDRISENKYLVSSSQKYGDMSLPLYLTAYRSSQNIHDYEVNISSGNKRCSELYTTFHSDLPANSDYNSNKNRSLHWSQHHKDSTDHQKPRFSSKNVSCKQSYNITADSQKTECSHTASSYNCYSDSVNFSKNKHEVISHCYWKQISNDLSDYQEKPVTTIFDHEHANSRRKAHVKRTSLNSRPVTQSASEFSVSEGSKKNYDNKSDYKIHQRIMLTDKLSKSNGLLSERQDSEDIPSVSSTTLSSSNEFICETPSSYKSLNSPKRKKYIADECVPSKIKKFANQKQTILPVFGSEVENIIEKSKQLQLSDSKYSERPSATVDSSEMHKCKTATKNNFRSLLVNENEKEQITKSHLVTDKLLEERNFLYAKQTPLPVDDMENELVVTDTYRISKSLKESLKDSEYFANLLTIGLRKVKKALEDIQSESRQAIIVNNV